MKVNTIEEKLLNSLSYHSQGIALECGERVLTYAELDEKADLWGSKAQG